MAVRKYKWLLNSLMIITGFATSVSGLAIQIGYHFGNPDAQVKACRMVAGLDYVTWSGVHKIASLFFLLFCVYHIYVHRRWYGTVLAKRVLREKNRAVLLFSLLFVFSVLTGLIPWVLDWLTDAQLLRLHLIEVHDKMAILLIIFIVIHTKKRVSRLFSHPLKTNFQPPIIFNFHGGCFN